MALRSMTGFGRAQVSAHGFDLAVEIRSVNHKGLDTKVSLPSWASPMEMKLMKLLRSKLHRGRVQLTVRAQRMAGEAAAGRINKDLLAAYTAELRSINESLGLKEDVSLTHLLRMPDVFRVQETVDAEALAPVVESVVTEALDTLIKERDAEGVYLTADFEKRLNTFAGHVQAIQDVLPSVKQRYFDRLKERVSEVAASVDVELNPERLMEEVIIYADRTDITEEMVRAAAHIERILGMIDSHNPAEGSIGEKLDFYFQELIRETNTTGSKSQSEEIAGHVVAMKSEIDRMREQVLNVE